MVRVQFCGIRTEDDLNAVVLSGASSAGFMVGQLHPSRNFVLPGTAARLVRQLPPWIQSTMITQYSTADEILDLITQTGITNIQMDCDDPKIDEILQIREALPASGKIMLAVKLSSDRQFPDYFDFFRAVDGFVLDSRNKDDSECQAAELTVRWTLFRRFADKSPIPVYLGGGITIGNVQEAISLVNPFGLDVCSSVRRDPDALDAGLCKSLVQTVLSADQAPAAD